MCSLLLLVLALVLPERLLLLLQVWCCWYDDAHMFTIRLHSNSTQGQHKVGWLALTQISTLHTTAFADCSDMISMPH